MFTLTKPSHLLNTQVFLVDVYWHRQLNEPELNQEVALQSAPHKTVMCFKYSTFSLYANLESSSFTDKYPIMIYIVVHISALNIKVDRINNTINNSENADEFWKTFFNFSNPPMFHTLFDE